MVFSINTHRYLHAGRERERETDRQTESETDRQTETDRETEKEAEPTRQKDGLTDRQADRLSHQPLFSPVAVKVRTTASPIKAVAGLTLNCAFIGISPLASSEGVGSLSGRYNQKLSLSTG